MCRDQRHSHYLWITPRGAIRISYLWIALYLVAAVALGGGAFRSGGDSSAPFGRDGVGAGTGVLTATDGIESPRMHRSGWRRPEVLLPVTFLTVILLGTVLLSLPGMASERVGPFEAFFTATSAVCVTGLIVVDTGADFTLAGPSVILALIPARRPGHHDVQRAGARVGGPPHRPRPGSRGQGDLHHRGQLEARAAARLWSSASRSSSRGSVTSRSRARSNRGPRSSIPSRPSATRGFSLNADFAGRLLAVWLPILALFVSAAWGFTTLLEILKNLWPRRHRRRRFSLHARLVFLTSAILWAGGRSSCRSRRWAPSATRSS